MPPDWLVVAVLDGLYIRYVPAGVAIRDAPVPCVVHRPGTVAEVQLRAERSGQIVLGMTDRVGQCLAFGQIRGDRRRQRASCAMRVRIVHAHAVNPCRDAIGIQQVARIGHAMPALDEHRAAVMLRHGAAGVLHRRIAHDTRALTVGVLSPFRRVQRGSPVGDQVKQHLGFGDVRRDHLGQGEQALGECSDGVVINELGAGRGDHHRIEHDMTCVMGLQPVRYRADEFRRRYHADLDRGRWNVRVHRVDLCGDHVRCDILHTRHAHRVLCGDRGDRAHAEHPVGEHGLQIGLNACAAGRITAGDGQHRRQRGLRRRCVKLLCHAVHCSRMVLKLRCFYGEMESFCNR